MGRRLNLEALEAREVPAAIAALDPSFGVSGKLLATGVPFSGLALQSNGKIIAVGTSNSDFFVARYNPDGGLDSSFDGDGIRTIDFGGTDRANAVAVQADGKIVVVGSTTSGTDIAVVRLTSTGALDTSFDTDGKLTINFGGSESANAVAIQPSTGRIVIAGTTGSDFSVIRLNAADGSFDDSFGSTGKKTIDFGGTDIANAVAIQANGNIVVAGTSGGNFAATRLLGSNGALDASFDTDGKITIDMGGVDIARGIALQANGNIVIAGSNGSDFAVVRLLSVNGALDTTFDGDGKKTVSVSAADDGRAVAIQPDGKILLIGDTNNNASDTAIVRLTSSGALDTTFNGTGRFTFDVSGSSFLDLGMAAVLTPQGRLIIAGQGGGGQVNGSLVRVPVEVEASRNLAIGGSLNGLGTLYAPDTSTGKYNSSPIASLAAFAAFGPAAVNARTAVGDVNGDGYEDTALVTGPGTAIRLAIISGRDNSTQLVAPFDPFGGNFTGGGFLTAADFDNDGRSEIVVTPDQGGGPRVSVFSLGTNGTFTARANFLGIDDSNFRGGARTAAGDVNADGFADLAVSAGFEGGPRIALFSGATLLGTRTRLVNDFFAFEETLRNGTFISIGDMNGDGYGDLYFGAGPGGAPRILGISGKTVMNSGVSAALAAPLNNFFLAGNSENRGGVRLASTDADGDGRAELVAGTGDAQASFARVYFGSTLAVGGEPGGFQDLNPFSSQVLADGIYVG